MEKETLEFLKNKANQLRKDVITMIYEAQSGHPGGSLSAADFVTAVYYSEMKIDPKNPKWEDRDRFVLSKGHVCPIQYAALADLGYFDREVLHTLRKEGSILQGHPDMKKCPGIDLSTGSLGQGVACGAGMALAAKRDGKDYRVFVVIGDGESQEGEIWEAAQVCTKYKLDNVVVFCDYNNLQIDGNSMEEIVDTLDAIRAAKNGKPKFILGKTVKGKGVSYMENQCGWHGKAPNKAEYEQAIAELNGGVKA